MLMFNIEKNENYKRQISLDQFLSEQKQPVIEGETEEFEYAGENDILLFFSEACNNEFQLEEIQVLHNLIILIIPYEIGVANKTKHYDYIKRKYDELNWRANQSEIKNRFGYLKKIIELDLPE